MNPNFGCDLRRFLFEGITESNMEAVAASLGNSISIFIPEINVTNNNNNFFIYYFTNF
jgi:phage baseplate assembly protein W